MRAPPGRIIYDIILLRFTRAAECYYIMQRALRAADTSRRNEPIAAAVRTIRIATEAVGIIIVCIRV